MPFVLFVNVRQDQQLWQLCWDFPYSVPFPCAITVHNKHLPLLSLREDVPGTLVGAVWARLLREGVGKQAANVPDSHAGLA